MNAREKMKTCPRCGQSYTGYPAVSRNGLGDICPACGQREALEAMGMEKEGVEELVAEIQRKSAAVDAYNATLRK